VPDPVLHVLAGPNGAGKTTLFREVIEPVTGLEWVNADDIAVELEDDSPERSYDAARLAAERRTRLIAARRSFATETVFSHPSKVDLVREALAAGYLVTLHVVVVPEELAVARVDNRVEQGGHFVPEDKIRERYRRLWSHVVDAIALAHETYVYDNSVANRPFRLVARFERGRAVGHLDWPAWAPRALRAMTSAS
jgi:predicted ABC-type ATPase